MAAEPMGFVKINVGGNGIALPPGSVRVPSHSPPDPIVPYSFGFDARCKRRVTGETSTGCCPNLVCRTDVTW